MSLSYSNMMNETKIYGNGDEVIFLLKDASSAEFAYQLKKPIMTHVQISNGVDETFAYSLGSRAPTFLESMTPSTITMDFIVRPGDMLAHSSNDGKLLKHLSPDLFKDLSVSQMFRVIKAKLDKREKK